LNVCSFDFSPTYTYLDDSMVYLGGLIRFRGGGNCSGPYCWKHDAKTATVLDINI